ncbi:hypothetical protein G5V59_26030 [Nocardioides sp. W3-2-3]|uniref:hypothetical protein n=1 Tax=Nocardioides convexus TaxID=2712224 RepID=UPI002418AB5A|nr:hypothetical protein [Nocardioides convexus]NHA01920.1 hypothetical protein [Nocardioides convexus]
MLWLAVVFALASAATTAVSTASQHLTASRKPWVAVLLAVVLGPVGFVLHVLALDHGPIGLVQPIAILGIVLAVPLRAALARSRPGRRELVAVAVTALAIAALLLATDARESPHPPDSALLLAAVGACAVAAALLMAVAAGVPHPTGRAFLLGSASGVLFGLMSVLIEADRLYVVLAICGVGGVAVNQARLPRRPAVGVDAGAQRRQLPADARLRALRARRGAAPRAGLDRGDGGRRDGDGVGAVAAGVSGRGRRR